MVLILSFCFFKFALNFKDFECTEGTMDDSPMLQNSTL